MIKIKSSTKLYSAERRQWEQWNQFWSRSIGSNDSFSQITMQPQCYHDAVYSSGVQWVGTEAKFQRAELYEYITCTSVSTTNISWRFLRLVGCSYSEVYVACLHGNLIRTLAGHEMLWFYETQRLITVYKKYLHWNVLRACWINSKTLRHIFTRCSVTIWSRSQNMGKGNEGENWRKIFFKGEKKHSFGRFPGYARSSFW